jgi:dihydrofolate reductase
MSCARPSCSSNATIDCYLAGPDGELDWVLSDPVMNQEFTDAPCGQVDTILTGRNAYHAFEEHFRPQAADPVSPPELVDIAIWMIDTPKVVFSRSLSTVSEGSRLASGDIPGEIPSLRTQPGKDMVVFGGVSTAQQFARHRLVDQYWIKVYPIPWARASACYQPRPQGEPPTRAQQGLRLRSPTPRYLPA